MYHRSPAKTTDTLPPNFTFSSDDPFYFGPATCELIHYKTAAYLVGFVEFIILVSASVAFWVLWLENGTSSSTLAENSFYPGK
uniref:Copper transporter n=1 Tax=Heterorhabditis bacteriophora TaxID=37862 RepID=A0A1I7XD28_HETBA